MIMVMMNAMNRHLTPAGISVFSPKGDVSAPDFAAEGFSTGVEQSGHFPAFAPSSTQQFTQSDILYPLCKH